MTDPMRWRAAVTSLRTTEQRCGIGRRFARRGYRADSRFALRHDLDAEDLLPPVAALARKVGGSAIPFAARISASLISLGQFDLGKHVRLQAFHDAESETATSLSVQGSAGDGGPGLRRAYAARREVAAHIPGLAPRLLGFGHDRRRGVDHLHERVVDGRHPGSPAEVQRLLAPLADGLTALHRGVGMTSVPVRDALGVRFAGRWRGLVEAGVVPSRVGAAVDGLVARDALVEVSLGHGDLVRTNMLRTDAGVVLLDWEYARSMPIAFDLAKPVFLSADAGEAVDELRARLRLTVAASTASYTLEDQLALGVALVLTWSDHRRERAIAAGRLEHFERDTERRVALLSVLLD